MILRQECDVLPPDPIEPVAIVHKFDEISVGGRIQESYNYLDYRFERDGAVVHARVYLYEPGCVSVLPPATESMHGVRLDDVEAPAFHDDVLLYLARRFRVITAPHHQFGYRAIWIQKRPRDWPQDEPWGPEWIEDDTPAPKAPPPPPRSAC